MNIVEREAFLLKKYVGNASNVSFCAWVVTSLVDNDPILTDFSLILFKKIINNKVGANKTSYTVYRIYYIYIIV